MSPPSPDARTSAPAARNTQPILDVLKAHLPANGRVLEIASGSGQHATAIAAALPGLTWQPSDPDLEARRSIAAWTEAMATANVLPPLPLDVRDDTTWPLDVVQAVVCINMVHISPWTATQGLMRLAGRVLTRPGGLLVLYGPYLENEVETAASNLAFDQDLRRRDRDWGLRDREAVEVEALAHGLHPTFRYEMPANNLTLLFRRL